MDTIKAVVLAAGKGTRLQAHDNDAPKVMREACGKPLLWYVLGALSFLEKKDIVIVVGYKKDEVINAFGDYTFAVQAEQLGTGHAVMAAAPRLQGFEGSILVCYGDMPIIKRETYEALINAHLEQKSDCTILTAEASFPTYGRVVRDQDGSFLEIVEERDCTPEQLEITELNSGVYLFRAAVLFDALGEIKNENSQGEFYLTDVPAILRGKGGNIGLLKRDLGDELLGVNTAAQLEQVEKIMNQCEASVE